MSTKSYTLIPYHLQDHYVQSQTKSNFPLCLRGKQCFGGKKTIFGLHILILIWVRYMCEKSHIHQSCRGLPQKLFSAKIHTQRYAEIHIQRPFFDNKNSIWKILRLKIWTVETCSSASSTCRNFYFLKTLKSRFLVVFQSFIFGQILANFGSLGSFGQIFLHSQWLRACPHLGWNLQNSITFQPWVQILHATACWKATIQIYSLKKFQKIQKFIAFIIACPRMQKPILVNKDL
jgi:hypothetical protein